MTKRKCARSRGRDAKNTANDVDIRLPSFATLLQTIQFVNADAGGVL